MSLGGATIVSSSEYIVPVSRCCSPIPACVVDSSHRWDGKERYGYDEVDEQRRQSDEDKDVKKSNVQFHGDVKRVAQDAPCVFVWADLATADYEAMWRQATEFADVARELRDIVRGIHPYADG